MTLCTTCVGSVTNTHHLLACKSLFQIVFNVGKKHSSFKIDLSNQYFSLLPQHNMLLFIVPWKASYTDHFCKQAYSYSDKAEKQNALQLQVFVLSSDKVQFLEKQMLKPHNPTKHPPSLRRLCLFTLKNCDWLHGVTLNNRLTRCN